MTDKFTEPNFELNLSLRKLKIDDLCWFKEVRDSVIHNLHSARSFSIEETTMWFETQKPNYLVIEFNSVKIGYCRIDLVKSDQGIVRFGIDLEENFRNKKLGFLVFNFFICYLVNYHITIKIIELEVLESNVVALSLYRKLGFIIVKRVFDKEHRCESYTMQRAL